MGVLTDLVPELGAPKHLDRDRALQRLRALLSAPPSPAALAPAAAAAAAPAAAPAPAPAPTTTTAAAAAAAALSASAARTATHDEHTPAAITTPVERPRLTACTFPDRRELAAFEAAVEGPDLLACAPPAGEEASGRGGSPGWERRLGGLSAARALVEARGAASEAFETRLLEAALGVLEDGEVRVRQAAGGCLAALAAARGVAVLDAALGPLLASIRRNFDREGEEGGAGDDGLGDAPPPVSGGAIREEEEEEEEEQEEGEQADGEEAASAGADPATAAGAAQPPAAPPQDLLSSLLASAYKPLVPGSGEMRHGTEGWKALETSVRALQQVVDALPPSDVAPRLGAPVRAVLYGALRHPNRFVRETGHFMLASASAALKGPELEAAAPELAPRIADGLGDNWSQVRYAAGVGARAFMHALGALDGGVLAACGAVSNGGGGGAAGGGGGAVGGAAGGGGGAVGGGGEGTGEGEKEEGAASASKGGDGDGANGASAALPTTAATAAAATAPATAPPAKPRINAEVLSRVVPVLLPPMCLNRYYVAAGVRLYAQASWRLLVGASAGGEEEDEEGDGGSDSGSGGGSGGGNGGCGGGGGSAGRAAVAAHCPAVVAYYVSQSKANNHAVREAACACMAELMEKVDREAVSPHVPQLLAALRMCFRDSSWPVRDAACTALGRCVLAYPSETRRSVLAELYELWAAHLWDNIPTVRENSAAALGRALRAYGTGGEVDAAAAAAAALRAASAAAAAAANDGGAGPAHAGSAGASNGGGSGGAAARCASLLRDLLPRALSQPEESARYAGLENTTTFGVAARKARDNDPSVHTGQDMFSCGSLTARFSTSRLVRSDGCMDHGFSRGRQPWEASDGGVHLLREYCVWWAGQGAAAGGAAAGGAAAGAAGASGGGGSGPAGENGGSGGNNGAPPPPADPIEFLPVLLKLARLDTFQHAANLRETVWKCLPDVARGVGARRFKAPLAGGGGSGGGGGGGGGAGADDDGSGAGDEGGYLALFAQAAVDDLRCGHQLAAAAAGRALAALRDAFGARVLAGRLRTEEARRALAGGDPNVPPPAPGTPAAGAGGAAAAAAASGRGAGAAGSLLSRNNDALLLKKAQG